MKAEKERKRLKIKAGKLEFKLRLVRSQIGKLDMEDVIKRNSVYSLKLRQSVNKQLDAEGGRFTPPKPQETVVLFPKEADRDRECESGPDDQLKDVKDKEEPEVVSSTPAEQEPQLQDQSKEEESGEVFDSKYENVADLGGNGDGDYGTDDMPALEVCRGKKDDILKAPPPSVDVNVTDGMGKTAGSDTAGDTGAAGAPDGSVDVHSFNTLQEEMRRVLNYEYCMRGSDHPGAEQVVQDLATFLGGDGEEHSESSSYSDDGRQSSSSPSVVLKEVGAGAGDSEEEQALIDSRRATFWAHMHNQEAKITSRDELLAEWTNNVENIQNELSAARIQQDLAEAIEDDEDQSNVRGKIVGKPPLPPQEQKSPASKIRTHSKSKLKEYPKCISLDYVSDPDPASPTSPEPTEPEIGQRSPFVEEPDSASPFRSQFIQGSFEELQDDDPRLALHRSVGQIDVRRRESGFVSTPGISFDSGDGDHWQSVEISELFVNPNVNGQREMSQKWQNEDGDGDDDETFSSTSSTEVAKFGGESKGAASKGTTTQMSQDGGSGSGDALCEWFKNARLANQESGDSQEGSENNAPLEMEVEEYPPENRGSCLRRMFSFSSVCHRIQGLISSSVQPCSTKSVTVLNNPNYVGHDKGDDDEDKPEQFGYEVWRDVKY